MWYSVMDDTSFNAMIDLAAFGVILEDMTHWIQPTKV